MARATLARLWLGDWDDLVEIELTVSGFAERAAFADEEIEALHMPLLQRITRLAADAPAPFIVLLAAPPGAGKSILAGFWEWLSQQDDSLLPAQALSIDGFHFPNQVLRQRKVLRDGREHLLHDFKGSPESYDLAELRNKLAAMRQARATRWPLYDRNIHDPVADAIEVREALLIVEGNYVLLDAPGWRGLRGLADFGIFLELDVALARERLRQRKQRGGYSRAWVEGHYARSDGPNTQRILQQRLPADVTLVWHQMDGRCGWQVVADAHTGEKTG